MNLKKLAAALMICTSAATMWADAPKYIFYCIGDGMGIGHVTSSQLYKTEVLGQDDLLMSTFPYAGMATTRSYSSRVTDSAAAGTALSTGFKTKNGMLGMGPDTTAVTSVAKYLFDKGYGVGLITTVAIDDATPGAFYAHVKNRSEFTTIGKQLAESGYQFAAGAGLRGTKDRNGNDAGLFAAFAENGMEVIYGQENLNGESDRVLLLSRDTEEPNNAGYTIDSIAGALNLPDMAQACIDHLVRVSPDRFFVMIEGGNIDHAAHANDGGAVIMETIAFDQAVEKAYEFYKQHPDETLIVVTADHETGGMGVGNTRTNYASYLELLKTQKVSKEAFNNFCKGIIKSRMVFTWDDMKKYLEDNFGFWKSVKLDKEQTEQVHNSFNEIFEKRNQIADKKTLYASFNSFSTLVFDILNKNAGVGWVDYDHTGNMVPVFAIGVGAERLAHMQDNTDIPRAIAEIAGFELPAKK